MKINFIKFPPKITRYANKYVSQKQIADSVSFSGANFDKNVLVSKKIIDENQDMNSFFDDVTNKIFKGNNEEFSRALKNGEISLSTSAYADIKHPYSATGLELDNDISDASCLRTLEQYVKDGIGFGINFSDFDNPKDKILKINSYLKYREPDVKRPPAAIGILDAEHPKVLEFIGIKDSADYSNWCFDLSLILNDDFMKRLENNDPEAKKIYESLLSSMLKSSEPGIIFSNNRNYLSDCCAAVPLKPDEKLTLGQINLSEFCLDGKVDYEKLKKDADILSQGMKKLDSNSYIGVLGYQELLNKLNISYGTKEAIEIAEKTMQTIQNEAHKHSIKTAISPTGNVSRLLKTTPSIEPDKSDYEAEIKTMAAFQKYLDGSISKTILLDKSASTDDVDKIIKMAYKEGLKGITVHIAR